MNFKLQVTIDEKSKIVNLEELKELLGIKEDIKEPTEMNKKELVKFLEDQGIEFDGRSKKEDLLLLIGGE